ncbi:MAG: multiheme c-type cytochrome [Chloroflexi bacterium]|nr:multiheme c-type cytochrome [Chloroflexota bacterium]
MSKRKPQPPPKTFSLRPKRSLRHTLPFGLLLILILAAFSFTSYESYASLYDADYVGVEVCADCHTIMYDRWKDSPHANMTHQPSPETVVGDFNDSSWMLPPEGQLLPYDDELPAMRTFTEGADFYMALRRPGTADFTSFKIAYVIGYQYRQTYLTLEEGGVLRRLPLQWSTERQEFFPYWNLQENSIPTLEDLWVQMTTLNSAWNLFCARCHTTNLDILARDENHTTAVTQWTNEGIACESCHGPGSQHVNYFSTNYVNRVVAFANSQLRGQPVAYIVHPHKLEKGESLSVCARCHGPDISRATTEIYREYEPGYSQEGRINDLSPYFQQFPLEPGRTAPTVEVWADGAPRGIAMIFRSFIESDCYQQSDEPRCFDCHDPHNNSQPRVPGILEPSAVSNQYCLDCHGELAEDTAEHTHHLTGTAGSYCYDCHLPNQIDSIVSGARRFTRTHWMSSLPDPQNSVQFGLENAPNACNECHTDQTPAWAVDVMREWYGPSAVGQTSQPLAPHTLWPALTLSTGLSTGEMCQ